MEILFDRSPLDTSQFQTVIPFIGYTLILPTHSVKNTQDQIIAVFDQVLDTPTTVTINDGDLSLNISVGTGENYGFVYYTPQSAGAKNLTVSHTGQSNINDPTTGLNFTVANPTVQVQQDSPFFEPEYFLEKTAGTKFIGYKNAIVHV